MAACVSVREVLLWKLAGLCEYDIRRPLTPTGTNLLGLVKHLSIGEALYFGEVFGRPFPEHLALVGRRRRGQRRACGPPRRSHAPRSLTATGARGPTRTRRSTPSPSTRAGGCPGGRGVPGVVLFNILVRVLTETSRHAGHADILREQLDGAAEDSDR
jgi:hypothetical protein